MGAAPTGVELARLKAALHGTAIQVEWETATDNDLSAATGASNGEVGTFYEDSEGDSTELISLGGATTDANYFRVLRAAAADMHDGTRSSSGNAVRFRPTTIVSNAAIYNSCKLNCLY